MTGNGDDFVREINAFQSRTTRAVCHELYGLVVLSNRYERQKRLLQGLEDKLRLGSERLTWTDVAQKNCFVRVKNSGKPEVRRFSSASIVRNNKLVRRVTPARSFNSPLCHSFR